MYFIKTIAVGIFFFFGVNLIFTQEIPQPKNEWGDEVFGVVEFMPRFPGYARKSSGKIGKKCDELKTEEEKKNCAEKAMLLWIDENLEYPNEAYENKIEGTVFIQFIVAEDGTITESKIVRDKIGNGCGEAAKKVIDKMNTMEEKWTPGFHEGVPVRVMFVVPVTYKLY